MYRCGIWKCLITSNECSSFIKLLWFTNVMIIIFKFEHELKFVQAIPDIISNYSVLIIGKTSKTKDSYKLPLVFTNQITYERIKNNAKIAQTVWTNYVTTKKQCFFHIYAFDAFIPKTCRKLPDDSWLHSRLFVFTVVHCVNNAEKDIVGRWYFFVGHPFYNELDL